MKQIGNWVFGSFFRTIGRLLVFVLLGFIIANVVDFGNIFDNFRITDLFFSKVNASTLVESVKRNGNGYLTATNGSSFTDSNTYYIKTIYSSITTTDIRSFDLNFPDNLRPTKSNGDYIAFQIMMSKPKDTTTVNSYTYDTCLRFMPVQCGEDIDGNYSCGYRCYEWTSLHNGGTETVIQSTSADTSNFSVRIHYTNGGWNFCELQGNQVYCPLDTNSVSYLRVIYDFIAEEITNMNIGISRGFTYYKLVDTVSAIESQTQQQHSDHQQTQSYLEDSNTTQAESEATDFFDDFSVDLGGLTGIITAPLSTIQSLLNSTCTSLVLPLPFVNENLTLPCMSSIYSEHFGAFYTLYQTIILGIIAYRCIMSIFFDIKGFTNPDDDRIEVMDL